MANTLPNYERRLANIERLRKAYSTAEVFEHYGVDVFVVGIKQWMNSRNQQSWLFKLSNKSHIVIDL